MANVVYTVDDVLTGSLGREMSGKLIISIHNYETISLFNMYTNVCKYDVSV